MTSTVTNYSDSIDTSYPVAGVDNDTQGFRTNFSAIKNAFTATSNEISSLQLNLSSISNNYASYSALSDLSNSLSALKGQVNGLDIPDPTNLSSLTVNGNGNINGNLVVSGTISGTFSGQQLADIANFQSSAGLNNTIIGATTPAGASFTTVNVNESITANLFTGKLIKLTSNNVLALEVTGGGKFTGDLTVNGNINVSKVYENGHEILTTASAGLTDVSLGLSSLSSMVQSAVINFKDQGLKPTTSALTVNYKEGRYQKFTLTPTQSPPETTISVSNWPANKSYGSIVIHLEFPTGSTTVGTPVHFKETRNKVTTYGVSSTIVDINDVPNGITDKIGVGAIQVGWGIYTDSGLSSASQIATVASIQGQSRITINPIGTNNPYALNTNYFFAPVGTAGTLYKLLLNAPTLKINIDTPITTDQSATINADVTKDIITYELYSYDGGDTVFVHKINKYN